MTKLSKRIRIYGDGFPHDTYIGWADEIAEIEAENEDLRLMLYGQTGWDEGEINERLSQLDSTAVP